MTKLLMAGLFVIAAAQAGAGELRIYNVTTKVAKHADFSKLKTYTLVTGWPSIDVEFHDQVIAAIERELAAAGLAKRTSGPSDVTVTYAAVRRTDVDLKAKGRGPAGERPTYPVASITVRMRHPITNQDLFLARAVTPIDLSPGAIEATINDRIAKMFARYPTRRSNH